MQARSREGGRGGSSPPPEIFRLELISATNLEFCYQNRQPSMEATVSKYCRSYNVARLCTLVLLCNLERNEMVFFLCQKPPTALKQEYEVFKI